MVVSVAPLNIDLSGVVKGDIISDCFISVTTSGAPADLTAYTAYGRIVSAFSGATITLAPTISGSTVRFNLLGAQTAALGNQNRIQIWIEDAAGEGITIGNGSIRTIEDV